MSYRLSNFSKVTQIMCYWSWGSWRWVLTIVLVQTAITKHHRLDDLNNIYFSQFWRLEGLRTRCWQIQCLGRTLSLAYRWLSSCYDLNGERRKEKALCLRRALISSRREPHPHDLIQTKLTLKGPSPNLITLGVRASAYDFCRNTNF